MKKLIVLSIAILMATTTFSQSYTGASENDPLATSILEKIRARYDSYSTVAADFSLKIEFPEAEIDVQKGKMWQEEDKYRILLGNREMISDGNVTWLYLKKSQEVQINCVDEMDDSGNISPKDLLRIYEQEDYIYYLSNEFKEGNTIVQQIEFKPVDRDSEYSKIRLTLEKTTLNIIRVKAFAKDGSRFTLDLGQLEPNKFIDPSIFSWKSSECPDCYVEDLRIGCE